MNNRNLKGKRYINLVRCSSDQQADTSPTDQLAVLNLYAEDNGLIHAGDDIVLEGISGSVPGARTDFDQIIRRKAKEDDFEVLLVQDVSRLTRGGSDHVGKILFDLRAADVQVVFAQQTATGDPNLDAMICMMGGYAAQQQAISMSYAIVRGQTSSFAAGKIPHSFRVPYGVDRLYLGPDDKPRHRTRSLGDGSQLMLAAESDEVLATYPKNPKRGESVHYKRQSDERIVLVPGATERVEIVRRIYRRRMVDGWGTYRIAKELNDAGARSADGKLWNKLSVKKIIDNPTFTGQGVAGCYAYGIYFTMGKSSIPQAVDRWTQNVAKNKSAKKQLKPESDWRRHAYPYLVDYLGSDLAELARHHHAAVLAKLAAKAAQPKVKGKPGGDRHVDSPYALKGLLRSKQGGHLMTGKRTGPKGDKREYYQVTRGGSAPITGSSLSRLIPARPLEAAVLSVARDVLLDVPNLRKMILDNLRQQEKEAAAIMPCDVSAMKAEREEVLARLRDAMLLAESARKLLQKEMAQWQAQLERLEQRITEAACRTEGTKLDADKVVANVTQKCRAIAERINELPPASLRKVLAGLVEKALR